jgi:hypothetical protein
MQQTASRAAGTIGRTPWLVELPNKVRPMPLLHSTDARTVGENDVMDREQRECVTVEKFVVEDEVPLSADYG